VFARARALVDAGRGYFGGLFGGLAPRRGIRIFRYHGVVERFQDETLERNHHALDVFSFQMAYLRRFRVLAIEELLEALDRPEALQKSAAVVTFDDGFANNFLVAEIMARFRLPWTLFVPVGEIGEDRALWLDEFSMLVLHGEARALEVLGAKWPLTTREEREETFRVVRPRLKDLPAAEKNRVMNSIRSQFPRDESRRLLARFPSLRMLSWTELEELAGGVAIGSHGVYHDVHHAEQPGEERRRELVESKRELETRLGRPCRAFAYPNGTFIPESPAEVASAGYEAALTTESGPVDASTSRYLLPRVSSPKSMRRFARINSWWDPALPPYRRAPPPWRR